MAWKDLDEKYLLVIIFLSGLLGFGILRVTFYFADYLPREDFINLWPGYIVIYSVICFFTLLDSFHYIYKESRTYKPGKRLPFDPYKIGKELDKPLDRATYTLVRLCRNQTQSFLQRQSLLPPPL